MVGGCDCRKDRGVCISVFEALRYVCNFRKVEIVLIDDRERIRIYRYVYCKWIYFVVCKLCFI